MDLGSIISAVAALLVLFPIAFITYVNVGGSYRATQYLLSVRKAEKQEKTSSILCSVDADCPPGYVCINGKCAPQF
jgi:hypothetical protein